MNLSTLLGMFGGAGLLAAVALMTTEDVSVFWNVPGVVIVLGGTIAATLLSYPLKEVMRVFRVFIIIFRNDHAARYIKEHEAEIATVARLWYKGDIRAVEKALGQIKNPFLHTGLQMVIDGAALADIHALLQWRLARRRARELAEAQIFRSMAAYAPAFGMLGTLLGLINMLHGMQGANFDDIGSNMGVALVTTLYGILLANLIFKPIAVKFERRSEQRAALMQMAMEGVTLIAERRSPSFTREFIHTYMAGDDEAPRPLKSS